MLFALKEIKPFDWWQTVSERLWLERGVHYVNVQLAKALNAEIYQGTKTTDEAIVLVKKHSRPMIG